LFQPRLWLWSLEHAGRSRPWVLAEGVACAVLIGLAAATPLFAVYAVPMIVGSWPIPLMTAHLTHAPDGADPLSQTRAFRGAVASTISPKHLYHLEHHLYPAVPHHNWRRLAERLDPHLERAGIRPIRL